MLQVSDFWRTNEGSRRGMQVYITNNPQRAGCTVGQMNGKMPAERFWVEGGTGNIERHPHLSVQPSVDQSNSVFLSSSSELGERMEWITCYNFRPSPLLSWL